MMDEETWFNAKKAVELGFADAILFAKEDEEEEESDEDNPVKKPDKKKPDEDDEDKDNDEDDDEDDDEKEKKKKEPFESDSIMFSKYSISASILSKVSDKEKNKTPIDQLEKRLNLLKH